MPSQPTSNESESFEQFRSRVKATLRFRCPWCRIGVIMTKTLKQMTDWQNQRGHARCPRCAKPLNYFMGKITKGGPNETA